MGEAHDRLIADGMTYERVYDWASYIGNGYRYGGWNGPLVWDGCMLN
jgi:hypothetical protein